MINYPLASAPNQDRFIGGPYGRRPSFECPNGLVDRIPALAQARGIRVEVLNTAEPNGFVGQYVSRTRFGHIVGRRHSKENVSRIWLVFPREHALNPLFWIVDFGLSHRIEQMLRESGASECAFSLLFSG
jgi:hypothetical protein